MSNFDDNLKSSSGVKASEFDPKSLAEKMNKFKFAKADNNKDQNWFSKINTNGENESN